VGHHEEQPTAIESVLDLPSEHGLDRMAEAMATLLNEAMELGRHRCEFQRRSDIARHDMRIGRRHLGERRERGVTVRRRS
jgi:hypothetical protein